MFSSSRMNNTSRTMRAALRKRDATNRSSSSSTMARHHTLLHSNINHSSSSARAFLQRSLPSSSTTTANMLFANHNILACQQRCFSTKRANDGSSDSKTASDTTTATSPLSSSSSSSSSDSGQPNTIESESVDNTSKKTSFWGRIVNFVQQDVNRAEQEEERFLGETGALLGETKDKSSGSLLAAFQAQADAKVDDAFVQNAYYRVLMEAGMYKEVCERFRSNRYASNDATLMEVMKAAILANELETISFSHAKQALDESFKAPALGSSSANPLYVSGLSAGMGWGTKFLIVMALLGSMMLYGRYVESNKKGKKDKKSSGALGSSPFGGLIPGNEEPNQYDATHVKVTFDDVIGQQNAKDDLREVVSFLKNPEKFKAMGGEFPRGLLLVGPPGTGKTLLAKAVAGEAKVPFFYANGAEFDEIFVGVGPKRVRNLFEAARDAAPCIVFIDEIDSVGGTRNALKNTGATLNQLLSEMDGFSNNADVFVLGATNLPDSLDKALLRPGRFDRTVVVDPPIKSERLAMLEFYGKKVKLAGDVDFERIARSTPGCTGADLFNIVNSAAIHAATMKEPSISHDMMEWAKDKVLMGSTRDLNQDAEAIKLTAYHEGGHAIMAYYSEGSLPIYKATIVPRGQALGMVRLLPEKEVFSQTKKQMVASIDVAMGGRVAEELIFGEDAVTSGASSDLERATAIARAMVLKYGMGARSGLTSQNKESLSTLSAAKRNEINADIDNLLNEAYERAKVMLESKKAELELLADALIEYETLDLNEIGQVLKGKRLNRERPVPKKMPEDQDDTPEHKDQRPLSSEDEEIRKRFSELLKPHKNSKI